MEGDKILVERTCRYCYWDWKEYLGAEELKKLCEWKPIGECPKCLALT